MTFLTLTQWTNNPIKLVKLIHLLPMHLRFSDDFRGYRKSAFQGVEKGALGRNGPCQISVAEFFFAKMVSGFTQKKYVQEYLNTLLSG